MQGELYEGVLIKESIEDDSIIDYLSVNKIELWNTGGNPKYWTVLFFYIIRAKSARAVFQSHDIRRCKLVCGFQGRKSEIYRISE